MRTFVIGDIHGNYKALVQCIERSGFNKLKDRLIVLGDWCDGLPDSKKVFSYLYSLPNKVMILGNHELFLLETLYTKICQPIHYKQGGAATLKSFGYDIPTEVSTFIETALPYYIDEHNNLYIHGGIPGRFILPIKGCANITSIKNLLNKLPPPELAWDRDLAFCINKLGGKTSALFKNLTHTYLGHTTTETFHSLEPISKRGITLLDTGAGWSGKLTMQNVETMEYFQSDLVSALYGERKIYKDTSIYY
jgi:serine/threonine protein phosphatase 1